MKKNLILIIIFSLLLITTAILLSSSRNNVDRLKVGMTKNEISKILGIKDKKIMEEGAWYNVKKLSSNEVKKIQVVFYIRNGFNFDVKGKTGMPDPKKILVLCFDNEKLAMWGYGKNALLAIKRQYPGFNILF